MELITPLLAVVLAISACLNAYQFVVFRRLRRAPPPRMTIEAEDLAHDLTTKGSAVVKMTVIDPANLILRRPRG